MRSHLPIHTTFAFLLALTRATTALAADGSPAFTCVDSAGIDYQIQGEYLGAAADDSSHAIGAHVIALGAGKFHAVGYIGGLPGDGWSRGDEKHEVDGEWQGDKVVLRGDGGVVTEIKNGKLVVLSKTGDTIAELKRTERKSMTLGEKAPADAIVLFAGSLDHFEDGKLLDGNLAATGAYTKKKMGDHHMHLEFRTPFMPTARGQARGNSGVYIQSRYELQVLDSFGLEGADNECGGIYSIDRPKVNACFPPLQWQTYDIDFTAAKYDESGSKSQNGRVTIRHNGILIHDNIELKHGTPGRNSEGAGPDSLFLQDHGNPVVFRNIWMVEK